MFWPEWATRFLIQYNMWNMSSSAAMRTRRPPFHFIQISAFSARTQKLLGHSHNLMATAPKDSPLSAGRSFCKMRNRRAGWVKLFANSCVHPSAVIFPLLWKVGESKGRPIKCELGADLIRVKAFCRVRPCIQLQRHAAARCITVPPHTLRELLCAHSNEHQSE